MTKYSDMHLQSERSVRQQFVCKLRPGSSDMTTAVDKLVNRSSSVEYEVLIFVTDAPPYSFSLIPRSWLDC